MKKNHSKKYIKHDYKHTQQKALNKKQLKIHKKLLKPTAILPFAIILTIILFMMHKNGERSKNLYAKEQMSLKQSLEKPKITYDLQISG